METWYRRYTTETVPITSRSLPSAQKVNNKLNHDYVGLIVNTKVNHFLGNPISITYDTDDDTIIEGIKKFKRQTAFNRVINELGKQASLYGFGCVYAYIDMNGNFDFIEIDSRNCYFMDRDNAAARKLKQYEDDKTVKYEAYDDTNIYVLEGGTEQALEIIETRPHNLGYTPLFKIKNNKEQLNDFVKVESLIDALDRAYSDLSSEIEQFRLAYIKIVGATLEVEDVLNMIQTGTLQLPEGSSAEFMTKSMIINEVMEFIKKEEQNLFKFALVYDPSDTDNLGQLTNLGIHFKMALINANCKSTIHYFTEALYQLFEIYSSYLQKKSITLDPYLLEFNFTLDTPRNLKEESEVQRNLVGIVTTETRLKQASFIENATEEANNLEKEFEATTDTYVM